MIAGESKSGKSTFINAYLGVELLPMDVKQCTSAIIEIKNGEEFYVMATYANGNKRDPRRC
jgi:GTPase Era involved in 16S rRNA processing